MEVLENGELCRVVCMMLNIMVLMALNKIKYVL